jgi:hypothetical protein
VSGRECLRSCHVFPQRTYGSISKKRASSRFECAESRPRRESAEGGFSALSGPAAYLDPPQNGTEPTTLPGYRHAVANCYCTRQGGISWVSCLPPYAYSEGGLEGIRISSDCCPTGAVTTSPRFSVSARGTRRPLIVTRGLAHPRLMPKRLQATGRHAFAYPAQVRGASNRRIARRMLSRRLTQKSHVDSLAGP